MVGSRNGIFQMLLGIGSEWYTVARYATIRKGKSSDSTVVVIVVVVVPLVKQVRVKNNVQHS